MGIGRRRIWKLVLLLICSTIALVVLYIIVCDLFLTIEVVDNDLQHFKSSRLFGDYVDNIQLLIEPSSTPCKGSEEVPLVIMVASDPYRMHMRDAIRQTYAKHLPTYFVLGIEGNKVDESLVDFYLEAKEYGDVIVYEFNDHYQNLTLKTGLMMKWFSERCPRAGFLLKTDDDVLINPRVMREVVRENADKHLVGGKMKNTSLHRSYFSKWHVPVWLSEVDKVEEYLEGPGYLIKGEYVQRIYDAAHRVPLINLEDIYFTYLVAYKTLGLKLTNDKRFLTRKPFLPLSTCDYLSSALVHNLAPDDMVFRWYQIEKLTGKLMKNESVCGFYFVNHWWR